MAIMARVPLLPSGESGEMPCRCIRRGIVIYVAGMNVQQAVGKNQSTTCIKSLAVPLAEMGGCETRGHPEGLSLDKRDHEAPSPTGKPLYRDFPACFARSIAPPVSWCQGAPGSYADPIVDRIRSLPTVRPCEMGGRDYEDSMFFWTFTC